MNYLSMGAEDTVAADGTALEQMSWIGMTKALDLVVPIQKGLVAAAVNHFFVMLVAAAINR